MRNLLKRLKRAFEAWRLRRRLARDASRGFAYDHAQFRAWAGALHLDRKAAACAEIVMGYHVLEKGLTMPRRRLGFGQGAVVRLIELIEVFEQRFGTDDPQVSHAVAVLRAYAELHTNADRGPAPGIVRSPNHDTHETPSESHLSSGTRERLDRFLAAHPGISAAVEPHVTREAFFASRNAPFPQFATSRHVCRHFAGPVPRETIEAAVTLALSAPSACNRQHARVHAFNDPALRDALFALQGGTRGFGADADTVLVVTSDLSAIRWGWERHDAWVNGGIFAMNLCLALHWHGVAHCILHWSVPPEADQKAHALLDIPDSEAIVLLLACGTPPDEFDVAASPRRNLGEILSWHGAESAERGRGQ